MGNYIPPEFDDRLTDGQKVEKLRAALGVLLDECDYRHDSPRRACRPNEMVGGAISTQTLRVCDEAMEASKP